MSLNYMTWMPSIKNEGKIEEYACGMNLLSYNFSVIWMKALGDRASLMRCDNRLVVAAQKQTEFLAHRLGDAMQQSMHIGPSGNMPNDRVRAEGYSLPDWFPSRTNNVESAVVISNVPQEALDSLFASPEHYNHLTGQGWFESETVYGIGNTERFWIIDIAPPE